MKESTKMHVVYLHPHFTYPGGAGNFVLETAKKLIQYGLKVTIIAQSGSSELIQNCQGIHFIFIGGPLPNTFAYWLQYFKIYKKVEKILDEIDPDIIFPQVFPANYWGFLYKKHNPKIPCIWFCHEPSAFVHEKRIINGLPIGMRLLAEAANPVMKVLDKKLVSQADFIFVNSHFTAEKCKKVYGVCQTKVVYPGVDISEYPPHQFPKEDFILCVSRLTRFKRIDLVLDALNLLKQSNEVSKQLIVVGDGEERTNLIEQSERLKLEGNVTFTGKLSRDILISYYARAQCVVFPTKDEPFGIIPIEAQAAWTPVIATRSGGPMESVIHEVTGFLIKPDSVEELAEKIRYLDRNKEIAESMGLLARENVSNNFSWAETSRCLLETFKDYVQ